jgi:transposase InsO family protein
MSRKANCYDNAIMESFWPPSKPNASALPSLKPKAKPTTLKALSAFRIKITTPDYI